MQDEWHSPDDHDDGDDVIIEIYPIGACYAATRTSYLLLPAPVV